MLDAINKQRNTDDQSISMENSKPKYKEIILIRKPLNTFRVKINVCISKMSIENKSTNDEIVIHRMNHTTCALKFQFTVSQFH